VLSAAPSPPVAVACFASPGKTGLGASLPFLGLRSMGALLVTVAVGDSRLSLEATSNTGCWMGSQRSQQAYPYKRSQCHASAIIRNPFKAVVDAQTPLWL